MSTPLPIESEPSDFSSLSIDDLRSLRQRLRADLARLNSQSRLQAYQPYSKQAEFHAAGAIYRERLFLGGNRVGKTECGAAEMAMHLTGTYPRWWQGKRFELPIRAWAAGITGESTRDVVQAKLLGAPDRREEWGTGMLPKDSFTEPMMGRGIANAVDMLSVRHVSGGWSSLMFKSYEKGREKWQGAALEVIWMDEEAPLELYTEALTRTNETGGIVYMTCTPLLGMSQVMMRFLMEK